jgi:hypothetical protein
LFQDYNLRAPSIPPTAGAEYLKELQNDIKFVTISLALPWKRRQTDKQTDTQTDRQTGRQAGRRAGRQTGKQADTQTCGWKDRQTHKQETNRQTSDK